MAPIQLGNLTLYSVDELSKKLDVTKVTMRHYLKTGRMQGQKVGGKWFISETSLQAFFEGKPQGKTEQK